MESAGSLAFMASPVVPVVILTWHNLLQSFGSALHVLAKLIRNEKIMNLSLEGGQIVSIRTNRGV